MTKNREKLFDISTYSKLLETDQKLIHPYLKHVLYVLNQTNDKKVDLVFINKTIIKYSKFAEKK